MPRATRGLHHVTAIAGDPQTNADFYVGTLGLRLVKRTVNHDDTGTYHFYFGDAAGTPGTSITFFPWGADGRSGEFGAGQTRATAYLIPQESVEFWTERLRDRGVDVERTDRFDETVLSFSDPDGIRLELVATDAPSNAEPREAGPVPVEHQLQGFHGVTLAVAEFDPTARVLTEVLGYEFDRADEREGEKRRRYRSGPGGPAAVVDLVETDRGRGQMGVGTVHHVAFAAEDVAHQEELRDAYEELGLNPTRVVDRHYFKSVYTREPGGVLFETATTGPGFTVDEDLDELGSALVLPPWLDDQRERIESELPPFDGPQYEQ